MGRRDGETGQESPSKSENKGYRQDCAKREKAPCGKASAPGSSAGSGCQVHSHCQRAMSPANVPQNQENKGSSSQNPVMNAPVGSSSSASARKLRSFRYSFDQNKGIRCPYQAI